MIKPSPTNPTPELEQANARLQELEELKDTFVSLVSHELRTPMTLVLGYLEMGLEQLGNGVSLETRQHLETAL